MAGRDPRTIVLTGTPGVETPTGVPVAVSRWYMGGGTAPMVNLHVESPMESSCGTSAPPAGHEHLFVLWRDDSGRFLFHSCSVAADLSTDDGRVRLAQAQALFGPGVGPDASPGTPAPPDVASIATAVVGTFAPLLLMIAFGVGLILGVVGVLKRTRFDRG